MALHRTPFSSLFRSLMAGQLDRRAFLHRATALGMILPVATLCLDAHAQSASPATVPAGPPDVGTAGQQRGAGGELRVLNWQAPTQLNGLVSSGDKDNLASCLVMEALLSRLPDSTLVPQLAAEVPSLANGGLADDLMRVTFRLKDGVVWSDGEPFTADDVAFTIAWGQDPANGAVYHGEFQKISEVEVLDDLTIRIGFTEPNPMWSTVFTGNGFQHVLPRHVLEGGGQEANDRFRSHPIGTGPYVVTSIQPGDSVTYAINERYREPNKPLFSSVSMKGGGDATAAARASLQTGDYDFAWNLAVEPDVLRAMDQPDNPGQLVVYGGLIMERINFNFSDPNTEVNGQRSEMNTPHPILSDRRVRQALVLGTDREKIASSFYFGPPEEIAVANALTGIPSMESPNTELIYDPEQARQLLDDAGWLMDGGLRRKDGKALRLVHVTTTSPLRQKVQAAFKANMQAIGVDIEIQSVDASIFFDSGAGNEQNDVHFYTDLNEWATGAGAPPPLNYMRRWYAGENNREMAQKSNVWSGRNTARYRNEAYDALWEEAAVEADMVRSAELFVQMNDILYNEAVLLPLVRYGSKVGVNRRLSLDNLALSNYEYAYWNIANWTLAE